MFLLRNTARRTAVLCGVYVFLYDGDLHMLLLEFDFAFYKAIQLDFDDPETPSVPLVRGASVSLSWCLALLTSGPVWELRFSVRRSPKSPTFDLGRMDRWLCVLNPHKFGRSHHTIKPTAPLAQ